MSVRVSQSIRLPGGVRVNLSNAGVGVSAGAKGMRVGIHSRGRGTVALGIPGTGVGLRTSVGGRRRQPVGIRPVRCALGRVLAPRDERLFIRGLLTLASPYPDARADALKHFEQVVSRDRGRHLSPMFFLAWCMATTDPSRAATYLRTILARQESLPDALLCRYYPDAAVTVPITASVTVAVPVDRSAVSLLLAEVLQARGDLPGAIEALTAVVPVTARNLSLAELYCTLAQWDEAIQVTDGTRNTDDVTCETLVLRARALSARGAHDSALEALREALRISKRSSAVLLGARYQRGLVFAAMGEDDRARREFAAVHALDVDFADVAERIAPRPTASVDDLPLFPGARVREARRRAGLTQRELAKLSGVSQVTISRIEVGAVRARRETLATLLRACGAP